MGAKVDFDGRPVNRRLYVISARVEPSGIRASIFRVNRFLEDVKLPPVSPERRVMSASETDVDSPPDVPVAMPELRRERVQRVSVRRRRSKGHRSRRVSWTPAARRRVVRALVVSVAVLVLMGLGLYLGLSAQGAGPA